MDRGQEAEITPVPRWIKHALRPTYSMNVKPTGGTALFNPSGILSVLRSRIDEIWPCHPTMRRTLSTQAPPDDGSIA